ncbi:MAG: T9SS type A sorting domain-containing protein [Bacteroidia bacterium]|nr:T9SS type A sorting domain-containing protein [Bacteroidia bacterium]
MKKLLFVWVVLVGASLMAHSQTPDLFGSAPSFEASDRIVTTTFFHWYASNGGQLSGPWPPLEGRQNWTGLTPWWKTQIKQVMMANIDVLFVHLIDDAEIRRKLFFDALHELRAEGYDVPKVAPFLDPLITWYNEPNLDLATVVGKDTFVQQYVRFYNQYFQYNTDPYAASYLAKMDDKLMLATWHLFVNINNATQFSRTDLESRLSAAFSGLPAFQQGIYMITPAINNPTFSFTDERVPLFEINTYFRSNTFNNRKTVQLKGGYWDQNVRTPGDFLPRDGGIHYTTAWNQVDTTFNLVYIESWNEYDEGTGIYAAMTDTNRLINNNPNTDVWSLTDDPFEYIRTTANGAASYNTRPDRASLFLFHDLPDTVVAGTTHAAQMIVRNEGNVSWTGSQGFTLQQLSSDPVQLGIQGGTIDDTTHEIPFYGGIFRGRPITFDLGFTAPGQPGTITTHWRMHQNGQPFGDTLTHVMEVMLGTGLEEEDWRYLQVMPNPATDHVVVNWQGPIAEQMILYNLHGQVQSVSEHISSGTTVKLPDLPGLYFLKVVINGQVFTRSVIRQ